MSLSNLYRNQLTPRSKCKTFVLFSYFSAFSFMIFERVLSKTNTYSLSSFRCSGVESDILSLKGCLTFLRIGYVCA